MSKRFDNGKPVSNVSKASQGWLRLDAFPTCCGVLEYARGGRRVRELRTPAAMAKALDQIPLSPITNEHSPASPTRLDHMEGIVLNEVVLQDDGWVKAKVQVMAAKAIRDIEENRRRQLSGGFDSVEFVPTPGRWDPVSLTYRLDGQDPPEGYDESRSIPFDGLQEELKYSHTMLCERGRAGPNGSVRYDSLDPDDGVEISSRYDDTEDQGVTTVKIQIRGIEGEVPDAIGMAYQLEQDKNKERYDAAVAERDTLTGEVTALKAERDTLAGEVTALKAEKTSRSDALDPKALQDRLEVLVVGRKHGVDYLKGDDYLKCSKPDIEVIRDALGKRYDALDLTTSSDDALRGMFNILKSERSSEISSEVKAAVAGSTVPAGGGTPRNDAEAVQARENAAYDAMCKKMEARSANA